MPYNWKTFIEVYLEDYHVAPFHPGLGQFVSCDDLRWHFGEWFSVQTVGIQNALRNPGSPVYRKWHEQVLRFGEGHLPELGAVWLTYYPNVMVEWYPHVLVISTLIPVDAQRTTNIVEFYYPEEIVLFEREFVEAERAAYGNLHRGRRDRVANGCGAASPLRSAAKTRSARIQSPMEDGMQHFHEFLRARLG
ncbi:MAG: SRPBCC family protein [Burkholderiaceae bacterium]